MSDIGLPLLSSRIPMVPSILIATRFKRWKWIHLSCTWWLRSPNERWEIQNLREPSQKCNAIVLSLEAVLLFQNHFQAFSRAIAENWCTLLRPLLYQIHLGCHNCVLSRPKQCLVFRLYRQDPQPFQIIARAKGPCGLSNQLRCSITTKEESA